jgi:hypothetical protein
MQADRDDRLGGRSRTGRHGTQTLITAIAVLILAGGAYLMMPGSGEDSSVDSAETAAGPAPAPETTLRAPSPEPASVILEAPDIPTQDDEAETIAAEEIAEPEEPAELPPPEPPSVEEIDALLRQAMNDAGLVPPATLKRAFDAPYVLDRGISSIDQLARGLVPGRSSNIARPSGKFATTQVGSDYSVDPAGYRRYDPLVAAVTALPPETLARLFHQQRALLEGAYSALGYPAEAMDNTVIAALDRIIAAPTRETPPALVSKGALWAYADPALESATDLDKQLLRSGPENTRALQRWARDLRDALLKS